MSTIPAPDPKVPGFAGGYSLIVRELPDGPQAGRVATVTNQRWDRPFLSGTRGHVHASVGGEHRVDLGVGKGIPSSIADALAGVDAAVRAFASGPAAPVTDASLGHLTLLRDPIAWPIGQEHGATFRLQASDPASMAVIRAAGELADAIARANA